MTTPKTNIAGLAAPMVVPIMVFLQLVIGGSAVSSSLLTAVAYGLISYLGFFVFILPLSKYLEKNKLKGLVLLLSGIIGGALIVTLLFYFLAIMLGSRERFDIQAAAIGSFYGGTVAIVFYFLSRQSKHP